MERRNVVAAAAAIGVVIASGSASTQTLDFGVYRATVEPIFYTKRDGFSRCVVCHAPSGNNAFNLLPLKAGQTSYTEDQSKKNFETVSRLVVPGHPEDSRILMYPLDPSEGGAPYHSGGRQWPSKKDPNWQAIARWINGQK